MWISEGCRKDVSFGRMWASEGCGFRTFRRWGFRKDVAVVDNPALGPRESCVSNLFSMTVRLRVRVRVRVRVKS
jgi:hypothetical protein